MDIYIMIAQNVLYDSYCEEGPVESKEYSTFYSNDVLFDKKIKKLLKPYGRFEEASFDKDWRWDTFTINEYGREFVENKNVLKHEEDPQECNWYEVSISFVFMGLLCGSVGALIYGLTEILGGFSYTVNLRIFQVVTVSIIIGFLSIVKSIYNKKHKNRNRIFLLLSALVLVYMIFYESVMDYMIEYTYDYFESGYDVEGIPMGIQYGCLGTIFWFLFFRKRE